MNQDRIDVISAGMGWGKVELITDPMVMEIMEKLKIDIDSKSDEYPQACINNMWYSGKTINEAVCNAAFEHFKDTL